MNDHPLSTFIIECTGDSMLNAFIPPKAKLVADKSITAKNGDIVIAVMNAEFTVKWVRKMIIKLSWSRATGLTKKS
ncbi:MAG: S24 family peptidase [Bacteroidota bacterium]